jgi:opacity protein-like surface antigen
LLLAVVPVCWSASAQDAQVFGAKQSLGITASYSPTSSHILIGKAQQRKTLTAGVEYTRRLWEGGHARLDYSGEFSPFFRESDPVMVGYKETISGSTIPIQPQRSIAVKQVAPLCYLVESMTCNLVYTVYGPNEITYATSVSPIGARAVFLPRRRLQPTFAADMGVVISSRDIPVDHTAGLNYQFAFGPGVQAFVSRNTAVRLEYIYRHISNADTGSINPGIDQGVFRLTLSRYR